MIRHPLYSTIALPLRAMLYIRQKDVPKLPKKWRGPFQTKLERAVRLLEWVALDVFAVGKSLWIVADGFYAKRPVMKFARTAGVVLVSRLRKDAALYTLPPKLKKGQPRGRGQPPKYGKPAASVQDILEAFADRAAIEQVFHDVKEVWGAGQQQVRHLWANIGAWHLNLWMHTLVELWAWNQPKETLCDRSASPWDDPDRRPSHADRRKALRRTILRAEYSAIARRWDLPRCIRAMTQRLVQLAM